jgi:transcriptional regulator with XRE-family HTH domain
VSEPLVVTDADLTVKAIGRRIRSLRQSRNLTLQMVAERTGLSASLISMVERGLTAPSIGTLVAVAAAFGVNMADLMNVEAPNDSDPVTRLEAQPTYETTQGVVRRVVLRDQTRGFEWAVNEYEPGTASAPMPTHHAGYEYGLVVEGELTVELEDAEHVMRPGDAISYYSGVPHRLRNDSDRHVRTVWLNFAEPMSRP